MAAKHREYMRETVGSQSLPLRQFVFTNFL
jgi:hypothetical protein